MEGKVEMKTIYYESREQFIDDVCDVFDKSIVPMFYTGMNGNITSLLRWLAEWFFTATEDEFKQLYCNSFGKISKIKCDGAILLRYLKDNGQLPEGF